MVQEFLTPLDLSEDALAIDAIRDVGPGGHFFGTPHTQNRYKTAFYSPVISDWRNYETWAEAGSPTAVEKANRVWKERLASYEEPYMDPAVREELNEFVDRRIAEGGAPTDF
jgi:trimethylamine--corrinoid protein Co-methyltransferase